jgi:hypothetical protein
MVSRVGAHPIERPVHDRAVARVERSRQRLVFVNEDRLTRYDVRPIAQKPKARVEREVGVTIVSPRA